MRINNININDLLDMLEDIQLRGYQFINIDIVSENQLHISAANPDRHTGYFHPKPDPLPISSQPKMKDDDALDKGISLIDLI